LAPQRVLVLIRECRRYAPTRQAHATKRKESKIKKIKAQTGRSFALNRWRNLSPDRRADFLF